MKPGSGARGGGGPTTEARDRASERERESDVLHDMAMRFNTLNNDANKSDSGL